MPSSLAPVAAGLFGASGLAATADAINVGPDLAGIAAIIAASAGMVSAVGAIVIALVRKPAPASEDDEKDALLLKLLQEKLERDEKKDTP